jgi:hypothetical protein
VAPRTALVAALLLTFLAGSARADAPLTQGFEDGAPAWTATGMWHVQADPQAISVIPAIADKLVVLPDAGALPAPVEGSRVAWFGDAATGTYCGADFATIRQTPQDGCTSTGVQQGTLTSPPFSLAHVSSAVLVFRAWWEIEAVNADIADQMRVEYSTDDGSSWVGAGSLNPLDPSWGGWHQSYSDAGARSPASWQTYGADISGAAGSSHVRVRFVFDSVDRLRNGFRGLLLDGLAVVDPLGATITDSTQEAFTDAPPSLSVDGVELVQNDDGTWGVRFTLTASRASTHDLGADWTVDGHDGATVATGHATIPAGQRQAVVEAPVTGGDAPYTVTLGNPSGGAVITPGAGSSSTSGGALPLIGLSSVGAALSGDGQVMVTIEVSLDHAATTDVSAGYSLTGSDGVLTAAGTITVPAGSTTATTSVTVPAEHAPYTVALSNAQGGLLSPGLTSATTTPAAGVSSVTPPSGGEQLVLGVRQGAAPTLNDTFELSVLSGTIRYHTPGGSYQNLPSGSVILPLGSVVDATNGHAVITVEVDSRHTLQQAELWEGKFGVFQVGSPAITELRLAGGDYSACVGSARKKRARKSAGGSVRHLWANAKGRFRTKGRFASATIRGTRWLTEDLCLATRVTVAEGVVAVRDFRRRKTTFVRAGDRLTVGALQSARFKKRRGVHPPKLSGVRRG